MRTKVCSHCLQTLPINAFSVNEAKAKLGKARRRRSECRDCFNTRQRSRREKAKAKFAGELTPESQTRCRDLIMLAVDVCELFDKGRGGIDDPLFTALAYRARAILREMAPRPKKRHNGRDDGTEIYAIRQRAWIEENGFEVRKTVNPSGSKK